VRRLAFSFFIALMLFVSCATWGAEEHGPARPDFATLMRGARKSLQENDFSSAREHALMAIKVSADQAQSRESNDLSTKINDVEQAVSSLETAVNRARWNEAQKSWSALKNLHPQNLALAKYESVIKTGLSEGDEERVALKYFYEGEYKDTAERLQKLIHANKSSARVYFYLGCSYAALGLMEENDVARSYLQKAHEQFAMARKIDPAMKVNTKFISPRILEIYHNK
jgi:tetratricopeptide (TPR) repeat protein